MAEPATTGWVPIGTPFRKGDRRLVRARCGGCGAKRDIRCNAQGQPEYVGASCRACDRRRRTKHGASSTPVYRVWQAMLDRCENPRSTTWKNYGGRGITVCARWHDFAAFLADMGDRPSPDHEIDRIDNDGHYEPGNCRWATRVENQNNKRTNRRLTFRGETLTMSEWARRQGTTMHAILFRLDNSGMTVEQALSIPFGDAAETRRQHGRWGGGKILYVEHAGERLTPHQWAKRTGLTAATIRTRVQRGWDAKRALTTPADPRHGGKPVASPLAA